MRTQLIEVVPEDIDYPESDGLPLAENTEQLLWIVKLFGGFFGWYRNDPSVFVASDLFWYPVEGERNTRTAPDIMIIFGRPKGPRRSYRQWREGGIPPQVVFEIRSPSNTERHMDRLLHFYQLYGVEEYYVYDPEEGFLEGWRRSRGRLVQNRTMNGYVSPRLNIRFDTTGPELVVYLPNGQPFVTPDLQAEEIEQEKKRSKQEKKRAEQEKKRADKLAAKLREMGIDPDAI